MCNKHLCPFSCPTPCRYHTFTPFLPFQPLQVLEIEVRDAHLTGRVEVGYVRVPLYELPADGTLAGKWWKLQSVAGRTDEGGEVLLDISYKVGKSVGGECGRLRWEGGMGRGMQG